MSRRTLTFLKQEKARLIQNLGQAETRLRQLTHDIGVGYFTIKKEHRYLVLRLPQWEERYQLSAEEWLPELLLYWRKDRKPTGLGVKLTTLFGAVSETRVQQYIRSHYPNGEHRDLWFARKRKININRKCASILSPDDYRKEIDRRRAVIRQQQKKRKPYRGTPWLT